MADPLSLLQSLVGASALARLTVRDLLRLRGVNKAYFEFVRAAMAARAMPGVFRAGRRCAYSRLVYVCGRLGVPMSAWRVDLEVASAGQGDLRRFCGSGAQVTLLMPGNPGDDLYDLSSAVEQVAACQGASGMVFPADGARGAWAVLTAVPAVSPHLTSLHVPYSRGGAVALLETDVQLPSLVELHVHGCGLCDPDLVALSRKFSGLTALNLSENRLLGGLAIVGLLAALPSLTSLDLGGIPLTVDERMARAFAGMPRLATLVFAGGLRRCEFKGGVTFRTLTALDAAGSYLPPWLLKDMPALRVLRMSSGDHTTAALNDVQLEELQYDKPEDFCGLVCGLGHGAERALAIDLRGFFGQRPRALETVVGHQRALRRLSLRGHGSDLDLRRLIEFLPRGLTELDLSGSSVAKHGECSLVSDLEDFACVLEEACPGLEKLAVSDHCWPFVLLRMPGQPRVVNSWPVQPVPVFDGLFYR